MLARSRSSASITLFTSAARQIESRSGSKIQPWIGTRQPSASGWAAVQKNRTSSSCLIFDSALAPPGYPADARPTSAAGQAAKVGFMVAGDCACHHAVGLEVNARIRPAGNNPAVGIGDEVADADV